MGLFAYEIGVFTYYIFILMYVETERVYSTIFPRESVADHGEDVKSAHILTLEFHHAKSFAFMQLQPMENSSNSPCLQIQEYAAMVDIPQ